MTVPPTNFPVKAVIFDWAGTMVDFGCTAPVRALVEVFAGEGLELSVAEARADMGKAKLDHLRAILADPGVAARWAAMKGAAPGEAEVAALYARLEPAMAAAAAQSAKLIPGAAQVAAELKALGVRIGSGTGYTRQMMAPILAAAAEQGYAPEVLVCAGETPSGRPAPLMAWKALIELDAWPAEACIKVDDAPVGMAEGKAAGCWTVGLAASGNEMGLDQAAYAALPDGARRARLAEAEKALRAAGADFVIEDVSQLMPVVHEIAQKISGKTGQRTAASVTLALPSGPISLADRLRNGLARAPAPVFALYGGLMAFGAYFAMYAFRKPFTVASFAHAAPVVLGVAVDFKIALVIAQVLGYALSKIAGVKVISETPPHRRAIAILGLIGAAELALVLFALAPAPWNVACLFANGLALGMIWGLVFGFLEGRRLSEPLGAMLCVSFIVSSGVVKSVGEWVMLRGWAGEYWMPAVTGLIFAPLLLVCVGGLAVMPPPNAEDERLRVARAPMDGAARRKMFMAYAPGLVALVAIYVGLTALRDFRDNFAVEIWNGLGFKDDAQIFTLSELPVGAIVLVLLSVVMFVRDNRRAFLANLVLVALGLVTAGAASLAFQAHLAGPVTWMILLGAGLYLAYTPFNALIFDRFIAASGRTGTAGFLIYVADASGYVSSVGLLIVRNFIGLKLSWVEFLIVISYVSALAGLVLLAGAAVYFHRRLARQVPAGEAADAPAP